MLCYAKKRCFEPKKRLCYANLGGCGKEKIGFDSSLVTFAALLIQEATQICQLLKSYRIHTNIQFLDMML